MAEIELIVFDVDGVLVDVASSYPAAIARTAEHCLGPREGGWVTPDEIAALKAAGGFNSDWDTAAAVVWAQRQGRRDLRVVAAGAASKGGGLGGLAGLPFVQADPPLAEIEQIASEIYAGTARTEEMFGLRPGLPTPQEGVWQLEHALVEAAQLLLLPIPKAIYTGRTMGELSAALDRFGFSVHFPDNFRVTCDGPYRKPDGAGLVYLAHAAGANSVLMVGDNVDDLKTALHAQEIDPGRDYRFCGIEGGALGAQAEQVFRALGAEVIAPTTRELLQWLRS
ncbi:MAG: HAD-IA family hydrolase [Thermaerobacter sp.]|nr:HAD-IA family hydrolase [Thermaerobacter sp.]